MTDPDPPSSPESALDAAVRKAVENTKMFHQMLIDLEAFDKQFVRPVLEKKPRAIDTMCVSTLRCGKSERMSTVYVFGAGASRHAGYPLASGMGESLLNSMLQSASSLHVASAEYLIDRFGKPDDFEDWMTQIESRSTELQNDPTAEGKQECQRLGNRLGWLRDGLKEWFSQIREGSAAPAYAAFSDRLVRAGDVVITFNYDDALERELRRTGKWDVFSQGYGFTFGNGNHKCDVLLLKLHGSINWLWNPFGGARAGSVFAWSGPTSLGRFPVILPADLRFLGYDNPSGAGVYQGGAAVGSLILPGRNKQFHVETSFGPELLDFWETLWLQAKEAVRACSKMVVCGYSLPTADRHARDLLFSAPPKDARIEVVSGKDSEHIAAEFKSLQFSNVTTFGRGYFEDWLAAT
jgi:hypothetical protein